tara:strand:- start:2308 stop:2595 length:288 start_codon:yes stop_codon:yes gene_type:complete
MLNFIKGILSLVGFGFGLLIMAIYGFCFGMFLFWFGRFMLMGVVEIVDFAPLITDGIKWVFSSEYSDIIQYTFIGGCTIMYPVNQHLGDNDNEDY